ncbi:GAF domain-containing protein [Nocardia thraciensis]
MYGERVLIETLGERDAWTALAVDGRPAQWRSVLRVLAPETLRVVAAAFERVQTVEAEAPSRLPGDRRTMTVSATPVVGPDSRAHAVQVRTTPAGAALPEPYSVAAFGYSADTRAIHLGDRVAGWRVPADRANWTVPEAFRRAHPPSCSSNSPSPALPTTRTRPSRPLRNPGTLLFDSGQSPPEIQNDGATPESTNSSCRPGVDRLLWFWCRLVSCGSGVGSPLVVPVSARLL